MTTALHDAAVARGDVIRAALRVLLAEASLSDENSSVLALTAAEDQLALAARDLARATTDLPPARQPKGWMQT